jgi:hypothetical protein
MAHHQVKGYASFGLLCVRSYAYLLSSASDNQ